MAYNLNLKNEIIQLGIFKLCILEIIVFSYQGLTLEENIVTNHASLGLAGSCDNR